MLGGAIIVVILIVALAVTLFNAQAPAVSPQAAAQEGTDVHAPTNLAVFTADRAVIVSWQPSHPAPDGYRVYRASGRRGPYMLLGTVNAPDIDTFTDDDHFTLGATYLYTVTAFNDDSESAPVGPAAIAVTAASLHLPPTPSPTTPPPRPVPTFDTGNAIPAVDEGTAGPAPTPLPTFRALAPVELTTLAREPTRRTKRATPRATPFGGFGVVPTLTATPVATPATTVGPLATLTPAAVGTSTPVATPTTLPPIITATATPTPTP